MDANYGSSSSSNDYNASLIGRGGGSSSRRRAPPFPPLEEAGDAAFVQSSFDPVNLLEVGLREWRDRTLSLQCLKKSRSVAALHSFLDTSTSSGAASFRIPDYRAATKRWQELAAAAAAISSTSDAYGDPPMEEMNSSGVAPDVPLPEDYYSSLAVAPHASLIHIVILYHQALCSHGLFDEACKIAGLLEGLQEAEQAETVADLQGMDLLLKDGLLELYLRIQPYLPPVPSQIVKFKSVTYTRDVFVTDDAYETVLTKAFECVRGPVVGRKRSQKVKVLKDVTGYLMPGTLTLVLGPPACGKSSLHHVLSGSLYAGASLEGAITYNDERIRDISIHRLAAMVGHLDIHLPLLTVRETLEFARECLLAFRPKHYGPELLEIMGGVLKIGQDPKLEINMSMMGLKHAADRLVGSLLTPSITEDERHRLTAAEMFSGAHAVYFFDQLHTVAEDSITYDLLTSIRIFTRVRQITFMASLLQPSSEVFDLFDRLILLNQGHVVYQGPRQDALPYFESLGYRKPKHLGVGEFLQEVTTGDGVAYLQPGFRKLEVEDFVSSYKSSNMHRDICRVVDSSELVQELWVQGAHPLGVNFAENKHSKENELESSFYVVSGTADKDGSLVHMSMDHTTSVQPGDKLVAFGGTVGETLYIDTLDSSKLLNGNLLGTLAKVSEPVRLQLERTFTKISSVRFSEDYVLGFKSEALLLMIRELKVTWRNKFGLQLRLLQVLVLSFFVGFLLFRVKSDADQKNMNLFRTAFFVSILNMTMFNVGQLPALMDERNIYYKQKGAHFFRPISYLLGKIAGSLPFSLCEGTIWTLIVYFLTGMSVANGGWHFFVYFVIIILTVLNGASMVRFFSFSAPDKEKAGMFIGLVVTLFILFAGFLLPRFKVPKYWLWMYYINPLQWAITALVINEYNSASYSKLCKDVHDLGKIPQCADRPNDTVGHAFLARGQFYTSNHWIAVSIAVLCAWLLLWNILTYLAMSKLQHGRILKAGKPVNVENKINAEEMQVEDVESAIRKLSHTAIPVTLSWHELSYDLMVPSIKKPRTILSYVSGWGEPYDMVALIGSEAAGKTTLLNCLAGRKVLRERIGGQILVNSYPKVQKDFGHIMGYVDKIDAYTPYMTVRETLAYSAALRLGKLSSKQKQVEFVEEVLELTELKHLEGALVVALINDITFDQEKRLAIATELVANPSVLFLDDPTKGLDSSSAARITRCLQQIAKTGRLVIVTLKYPSQRILSMFTKVQILKTGGETVYFGPVGKNSEMIRTYFEAIPGTPLCPPNKSISTYAVDVIGDRVTYRKSVKDYAFEYRVSELALRNHVHLQHLRRSKGQNGPEIQAQDYGANFASMLHQTIMTIQRQYWRNVNYSWGRMISYLITSLILGSVFFKIDIHTTAGMNSGAGAIFISCVLVGLTNAQNAIPQVMQMRAVYQRERAVHQANVFLYNIAYTLAEIPYLMAANLIFCSIYLPMTNIAVQSAAQFLKYWFISLEFYMVITFLGMLLAVISPLPQIASVLVPIVVGIWVSTAGLVVPKSKILHQFIWIFWTNPLQYALDGLTSVSFFCDLEKAVCLNAGLNPACESQPSACPLCDCPRLVDTSSNTFVWRQIASNRSLHYSRVPYDMLALFLSAVLIRFLTLVALRYMKHNKTT